jgi:hypothetical protein
LENDKLVVAHYSREKQERAMSDLVKRLRAGVLGMVKPRGFGPGRSFNGGLFDEEKIEAIMDEAADELERLGNEKRLLF